MTEKRPLSWWKSPRDLLRQILQLDDSPHHVALGVAIGVFIGMTPTVGIQMILVLVLAFLAKPFFRFNNIAALITVYISNPFTVLPIYWFDYKVGTLFVEDAGITKEQFEAALTYKGFAEWWDTIVTLFVKIGAPLIIGSLVVATISGTASYPVIRWLLRGREKRGGGQKNEITTDTPGNE